MNHTEDFCRSNLLMSSCDTALLIIDVQDRLLSAIPDHNRLRWNLKRLATGAQLLKVPILVTEQYPEKLGSTISEFDGTYETAPSKLTFSCCGSSEFTAQLRGHAVHKILVTGLETHVCVLQTVMDLLTAGFEVFIAVDAIASRFEIDRDTALRRMESSGVTMTTVESALFEWCEKAGTPEFKEISKLIRETAPE